MSAVSLDFTVVLSCHGRMWTQSLALSVALTAMIVLKESVFLSFHSDSTQSWQKCTGLEVRPTTMVDSSVFTLLPERTLGEMKKSFLGSSAHNGQHLQ